MASGNTLLTFTPLSSIAPSSLYANFNTRNGHLVLEFDASVDWATFFENILPRHYAGGGLTLYLHWMAATATTGNVIWNAAFEALSAQDADSDGFASAQASSADACNGTSGIESISTITFTNGAQMDSIAAGESFRLKISRDADNGSDTMAGLAQLTRVEIKET